MKRKFTAEAQIKLGTKNQFIKSYYGRPLRSHYEGFYEEKVGSDICGRPFLFNHARKHGKEKTINWVKIFDVFIAILKTGLNVFLVQLFLPDYHKIHN